MKTVNIEIKSLFVPYEEALALEELGFDEYCFVFWTNNPKYTGDNIQLCVTDCMHGYSPYSMSFKQDFLREGEVLAPTYSQVFKWFRDNHNLFFCVDSVGGKNGYFFAIMDISSGNNLENYTDEYYTYEEAELECLKKLIEIIKNR